MRPGLLIFLYLAIVLLPLALAGLRISPPRSLFDELASGAGLLAYAVMLAEFILSGRFRIVSKRIGMDVTMRFHQLLARTALALALVHPFLYRAPFAPERPWDPTRELTLSGDMAALSSGALAWVLLPAFVLLAIGRDRLPYRYETWRLMHGLGALLIAGLVLHHTLNAGRYSQDPALAALWIALAAIALVSMIFVYILRPLGQLRRPWRVAYVQPVALKTWEVALEPVGHDGLAYKAGQFVWLNIGHSPFSLNENPFSISSAPASGQMLRFVIKELGDFTRSLGRIEAGTRAYLDGPHGNLTVDGRTEPGIALIAGGVGVAPLLGILRQLRLEGDSRPTVLIYGNRIGEQIVHDAELQDTAREHGTRIVHVLSEPAADWQGDVGLVDADVIRGTFDAKEMKDWLYVQCGPPVMMDVVERTLISMGVPASHILSERFKYD
jgi:predicted ferric reductase